MSEEVLVGKRSDLDEGARLIVDIGGREIGLLAHEGTLFAYENRCLHQGGPVCEGKIFGRVQAILGPDQSVLGERFSTGEPRLVCPWHGWEYDLRTGRWASDARRGLRRYDVVEREGAVYVVVPDV